LRFILGFLFVAYGGFRWISGAFLPWRKAGFIPGLLFALFRRLRSTWSRVLLALVRRTRIGFLSRFSWDGIDGRVALLILIVVRRPFSVNNPDRWPHVVGNYQPVPNHIADDQECGDRKPK
jgi:hypothetical protein